MHTILLKFYSRYLSGIIVKINHNYLFIAKSLFSIKYLVYSTLNLITEVLHLINNVQLLKQVLKTTLRVKFMTCASLPYSYLVGFCHDVLHY